MNENNLHEYQRYGVNFIIDHPYCGLFLDCGLGKTVTTLTAINHLMYSELEIRNCLIIAPKRVAETVWSEEIEKWEHLKHLKLSKIIGPEKKRIEALSQPADIYIISRDNITWLCSYFGGGHLPYDMLVIDELSSFKSYKALRFKALKVVRPSLQRVVGLTGTPAPNGLIDLWPQMYLIDRGQRLEKTVSRYRDKYFKPGRSNGAIVYNYVPLQESEAKIHEAISDICVSMKANDYLKMPERIDNYIKIYLPPEIQAAYNKFEEENILQVINSLNEEQEVTALNAAALANKLLQFANGAVYDENRNVHEIHDLKIDALRDLIEDSNGQPILCAWAYQHDRDRIMKKLKAYNPRELKTEKDIKDWNDGKINLLLAHPASVGHGLNLQRGGHIIVWFGNTWSLELYQQFNARILRQGQTKESVIIHHLVAIDTHDKDVIAAIANKDKKQNALLDSIKAKISKYLKNR